MSPIFVQLGRGSRTGWMIKLRLICGRRDTCSHRFSIGGVCEQYIESVNSELLISEGRLVAKDLWGFCKHAIEFFLCVFDFSV